MNRRKFLKSVGLCALSALVPFSLDAKESEEDSTQGYDIVWPPVWSIEDASVSFEESEDLIYIYSNDSDELIFNSSPETTISTSGNVGMGGVNLSEELHIYSVAGEHAHVDYIGDVHVDYIGDVEE